MKRLAWRILVLLRIYPHIFFTYSPFKILEFKTLTAGVAWRGDEEVLDIGCGEGLQTFLLGLRCGQVTGIDVNPDFIAEARWFARHLRGRISASFLAEPLENCGFPNETFDLIYSICVIEHIPNDEKVLHEAWRCLKPGGEVLFSVDTLESITDPDLLRRHAHDHHVVRYFREEELSDLLRRIGFVDVTAKPLFRSELAQDLFERGIRRGFNFGRLRAPLLARRLALAEKRSPDHPGIFLMARARKPL